MDLMYLSTLLCILIGFSFSEDCKVYVCGTLCSIQPVVRGRRANFTFVPKVAGDPDSVTWYILTGKEYIKVEELFSLGYETFSNGLLYTMITPNLTESVSIYIKYRKSDGKFCGTPFFRLNTLTLQGCGMMYRTTNRRISPGEDVELRYIPSDAVIEYPHVYVRYWVGPDGRKLDSWKYNEENRTFNNEFALIIRNFQKEMNGNYSLQCTNQIDNVSTDPVYVYIPVPPSKVKFKQVPIPNTNGPQYELELQCVISNATPTCKADIYGDVAGISTKGLVTAEYDTVTKATINVTVADNGKQMFCSPVCYEFPNIRMKDVYNVTVPSPPIMTLSATNSTMKISEGETLTLTCIVEGIPESDITWSYPDVSDDTVTVRTCGQNQMCLDVLVVTKSHEGNYMCRATNSVFGSFHKQFFLEVVDPRTEVSYGKLSLVPIIIGVIASVVLLLGICLVVLFKRRKSRRTVIERNSESEEEQTYRNIGLPQGPENVMFDTIANVVSNSPSPIPSSDRATIEQHQREEQESEQYINILQHQQSEDQTDRLYEKLSKNQSAEQGAQYSGLDFPEADTPPGRQKTNISTEDSEYQEIN